MFNGPPTHWILEGGVILFANLFIQPANLRANPWVLIRTPHGWHYSLGSRIWFAVNVKWNQRKDYDSASIQDW